MTLHAWTDPVTGSGRDASRDAWNKKAENLLTLHAGTTDPPYMRECMMQVRTDTDLFRGRTKTNSAWLTLGKWEANLGMVRIDGSNAMTADLDFNGKCPLDIENAVPTGAPSGTPQKRFGLKVGATTYWVPGYTATF